MKEIRIAYTGGGTGGHIYPLLSVASEVKKQSFVDKNSEYRFYYFGAPGQYSKDFLSLGIKIVRIMPFKIRRYFSLLNFLDVIKMPFAIIQAIWKMLWVMPDVLFSKGGTGAVPVIIAAVIYRVPIFIHDSDSVPGSSSSFSFRFAKRVGVSFEKALDFFGAEKTAVVGNPIRSFLMDQTEVTKDKAKKIFGFDSTVPLILVLGGSQGSVRVNDFMLDIAPKILAKYQILHQTGIENYEKFKSELAVATEHLIPEERARYKIVNFFGNEIKEAMIAADVVISRAGSGAIFEIAYFRKPSILIPLAESARNHQFYNAYEYARSGAAIVVEENNLRELLFTTQLDNLMKDPQKYELMSRKAGEFAKPMAASVIAKEIINLAK